MVNTCFICGGAITKEESVCADCDRTNVRTMAHNGIEKEEQNYQVPIEMSRILPSDLFHLIYSLMACPIGLAGSAVTQAREANPSVGAADAIVLCAIRRQGPRRTGEQQLLQEGPTPAQYILQSFDGESGEALDEIEVFMTWLVFASALQRSESLPEPLRLICKNAALAAKEVGLGIELR